MRLLQSIQHLEKAEHVSMEIVVVNDGSTDDTQKMLQTNFPDVKVISGDGNWWWTKCINEGMKFSFDNDSDYVLWMNDDNDLDKIYMIELIKAYQKIPKHAILGSASVSIEKPRKVDAAGYSKHNKLLNKLTPLWSTGTVVTSAFTGIYPTCSLSGRGTLIPASVYKELGLLDEQLVQYASDDDYVMRAISRNIPAYISLDAQVLNYSNLTSKERNVKSQSIQSYLKSFFNPYSANSLKKHWYIYSRHCMPLLAPVYVIYMLTTSLMKFIINRYIIIASN